MARLLPSALLTRAAVVLDGLGFDVERATDPDAGPILVATDPDEAMVVVSVTDLGLELSDTLGLRPSLPQEALDALANASSAVAHVARFTATAASPGDAEAVLFGDAVYAGAFDGKSFGRFVEAFTGDVYAAFEIADEAGLLLHPSDPIPGDEASAPPPAAPKTGTGRLARGA